MKSLLLLLAMVFFVSGCASLTKEQCENPDWEHIGEVDGSKGLPTKNYKYHVDTCRRKYDAAEKEVYLKGWNKSIGEFCTAKNGYESGAFGLQGSYACDAEQYPDFHEQFKLGQSVRGLKSQKSAINEKIRQREEDNGTLNKVGRSYSLLSGQDPDADLTPKIEELDQKIGTLERNAAAKSDPMSEIAYHMEGNGKHVMNYTGAYIGTFFGFGIGHAFQGRYMDDGWKWTLGEVATLGTIFATADQCENNTDPLTGEKTYQCSSYSSLTVLAWIGFRVWQGYDLWHYASTANNIYAMPTKDGLILGYRF